MVSQLFNKKKIIQVKRITFYLLNRQTSCVVQGTIQTGSKKVYFLPLTTIQIFYELRCHVSTGKCVTSALSGLDVAPTVKKDRGRVCKKSKLIVKE